MAWIWQRKTELVLLAVLLALLAIPVLIVRHHWPVGVSSREAWLMHFYSVWTSSTSESGCEVQHVLNDAGAAHSGQHFVWVLHRDHPWSRPRVIVSGWSELQDASEAIRWTGPRSFSIELSESRREPAWRQFDCSLDPAP